MTRHYEKIWEFKTARFSVVFDVTECLDDPADSFEFAEDIDAVRDGNVAWFDARVRVLLDGREVGSDHLGGCAYNNVEEFYTTHRDADPMNRNCSIMRRERGDNVVICHYFPSMVCEAIAAARKTLCNVPELRCA